MSELLKTLNAKVNAAEALAQIKNSAEDKKKTLERASEVAKGNADAKAQIPIIEKEMLAAAEKNQKTLRVSIASPSDSSSLSRRAEAECQVLLDYFRKKGITAVKEYDYDDGKGDSFYGGKHWDHYMMFSW